MSGSCGDNSLQPFTLKFLVVLKRLTVNEITAGNDNGILQINSLTAGSSTEANGGYLRLNINGVIKRVPYFDDA